MVDKYYTHMFLTLQEQCCRVLVERDAFVELLTFLLGPLSSSGSKNVSVIPDNLPICNNCIQYLFCSIHIVGILENLFLYFLCYPTFYGIPTSHIMKQTVRHINDIIVQPLISRVC